MYFKVGLKLPRTNHVKSALLWDFTHRRLVVPYGPSEWSNPRRWDLYFVPKRWYRTTNLPCV